MTRDVSDSNTPAAKSAELPQPFRNLAEHLGMHPRATGLLRSEKMFKAVPQSAQMFRPCQREYVSPFLTRLSCY